MQFPVSGRSGGASRRVKSLTSEGLPSSEFLKSKKEGTHPMSLAISREQRRDVPRALDGNYIGLAGTLRLFSSGNRCSRAKAERFSVTPWKSRGNAWRFRRYAVENSGLPRGLLEA